MTKVEANVMTRIDLAMALAARKTKDPISKAEWVKTYLRHRKAYLVALLVEQTTRKNSKAYPAAKLALQTAARSER